MTMLLGEVTNGQPGDEQHDHHGQERPSGARPADHHPERDRERRGQDRDRQHRKEVRERRRILVGVRPVGIEEPAAVGAQVLDELERSHRSLSDDLLPPLERPRDGIRGRAHGHPLPDEHEATHERQRQEDPQEGAYKVDPEVAQCR
jgi:hypothetical protein